MTQFFCGSCSLVLADSIEQRAHYHSDYHKYNVKRFAYGFTPVSESAYELKAAEIKQKEEMLQNEINLIQRCNLCKKTFNSINARKNHEESKKHKQELAKLDDVSNGKSTVMQEEVSRKFTDIDEEDAWTDDDSEEEIDDKDAIKSSECLFCVHTSDNDEHNLIHMVEKHSFYIPDSENMKDLNGLLTYLGFKVGVGCECIKCDKHFVTIDATRKHMHDCGHSAVILTPDLYDFYEYEFEDMDEDDESEMNELAFETALNNNYSLQLPSGITIGNRQLKRYYKQRLNTFTNALVQINDRQDLPKAQSKVITELMKQQKSVAQIPSQVAKQAARARAKDQKFIHKQMQRMNLKLGLSTNKLFKVEYTGN